MRPPSLNHYHYYDVPFESIDLLVMFMVIPFLLYGGYLVFSRYSARKAAELLARDGVTGTARVVSVKDTGLMINYRARVRFQFDIQPDAEGPSIHVEKALLVTTMEAPWFLVGMKCKVRYLPSNPKTFRFEGPWVFEVGRTPWSPSH